VQTSNAATELARQNTELGQVERMLADKQRSLSVASTRLDQIRQQLARLEEQVAGLNAQRTAIEAEIARRRAIAKGLAEVRRRLARQLQGDLAQLRQAGESALAQADAIQQSLQELEIEPAADQAQKTGRSDIADQGKAIN
jgi:chromosome segregation ATPase